MSKTYTIFYLYLSSTKVLPKLYLIAIRYNESYLMIRDLEGFPRRKPMVNSEITDGIF